MILSKYVAKLDATYFIIDIIPEDGKRYATYQQGEFDTSSDDCAILRLEETYVSAIDEKFCTESSTVCNRAAIQR